MGTLDFEAEILRVQPDASRMCVGEDSIIHYENVTPAHSFDYFVQVERDHFMQIRTRDGYHEGVLSALFARAKAIDVTALPADCLTVLGDFHAPLGSFTALGVAPPALARCFEHGSEMLKGRGYWIFPLLAGEFDGGESEAQFAFDIGNKGRRIRVIDWGRGVPR